MAISREAVIYGFKFFLGRIPESEEGIKAHMNLADESALAKVLLQSKEFSIKKPFDFVNTSAIRESLNEWNSASVRIIIVGNCQGNGLSKLMQAMSKEVAAKYYETTESFIQSLKNETLDLKPFIDCNLILAHPRNDWIDLIQLKIPNIRNKLKFIPPITFSAFHPDCVYVVENNNKHVASPIGAYNSSLIFYGWKNGLSKRQTMHLFTDDIYEKLGFYNYWDSSVESLKSAYEFSGLLLEDSISKWTRNGCWMHSINHPKLYVLADLARAILAREGISATPNVENYLKDDLAIHPCWPTYPEIGEALGIPNLPQPYFKKGEGLCPSNRPVMMLNLEEFIDQSYVAYNKFKKDDLVCDKLDSERYKELDKHLKNNSLLNTGKLAVKKLLNLEDAAADVTLSVKSSQLNSNPYQKLPDYQFWRRSLERVEMSNVDPVVRSSFKLNKSDKVATAGSCFAQHISRTLQKQGFNYYVAEKGDSNLNAEEAQRLNYGVFSARFGNLYSAKQLVQLFDRAYDAFSPADQYWLRDDGKFVDPFRPQVEPNGFDTIEDLESDRKKHFAAVREMFENLDVLVFTLGLTEAWQSRYDGAVFPLAPGVVAGEMDSNRYEFINFNVTDVIADMQCFVKKLMRVNPQAKMLITVSPVPLIATYEDRHVLVSTTYSKSVLRAAAEEVCKRNKNCEYFPSYEIITGNYTKGSYFDSDLRSVKDEGVEHVMKLFIRHYSTQLTTDQPAPIERKHSTIDTELIRENAKLSQVICDEEALDAGSCG